VRYLGYRTALCLALALASINVAFFLYAYYLHWRRAGDTVIYASFAVVLLFGLWVHSRIARYAGGVIRLVSAAAAAWPIATGTKPVLSILLLWIFSMGVLSLLLGLALLFSKSFAAEFERQRVAQPVYKRHLRNGAILALAIAAAIATYNDLVHLFSL
jgi:hypothetical protein